MTTIRRATRQDLPAVCALALREHAHSRMAAQPLDMAHVQANLLGSITGLATAVFVSESAGRLAGVIVGMVQPGLINRRHTAYELLWYAEDGAGLRLLAALKAWATRMRAVELVVHNYAGITDPARFTKAMARKGYSPLGTSYVAALEV